METFVKIAEILEVDINELLRIEKKWYVFSIYGRMKSMSLQKTKTL